MEIHKFAARQICAVPGYRVHVLTRDKSDLLTAGEVTAVQGPFGRHRVEVRREDTGLRTWFRGDRVILSQVTN